MAVAKQNKGPKRFKSTSRKTRGKQPVNTKKGERAEWRDPIKARKRTPIIVDD